MLNTYLVSVDVGTMRTKQQLLITWSTWSQMPMRNPDFYIPSRCGSNKVPDEVYESVYSPPRFSGMLLLISLGQFFKIIPLTGWRFVSIISCNDRITANHLGSQGW